MSELEKLTEYVKRNAKIKEGQIRKEPIKSFSGKILGYIEYRDNGDQELKNYAGIILGKYVASRNATLNYSGVVLTYGNTLTMLLKDTK